MNHCGLKLKGMIYRPILYIYCHFSFVPRVTIEYMFDCNCFSLIAWTRSIFQRQVDFISSQPELCFNTFSCFWSWCSLTVCSFALNALWEEVMYMLNRKQTEDLPQLWSNICKCINRKPSFAFHTYNVFLNFHFQHFWVS